MTKGSESFGTVLKRMRQSKKGADGRPMTQRTIAGKLGMDFAYYSRMEADKLGATPKRETIDRIAAALECAEAERQELLAAAGRVSEEMLESPQLLRLYRSAAQLSETEQKRMADDAEKRLARKKGGAKP